MFLFRFLKIYFEAVRIAYKNEFLDSIPIWMKNDDRNDDYNDDYNLWKTNSRIEVTNLLMKERRSDVERSVCGERNCGN